MTDANRREIAEALLCASRAAHAAVGLFSPGRLAILEAEVASAPGAAGSGEALPAISRSLGLLELRAREPDAADATERGVLWLSSERCLIGLRGAAADDARPFVALVRPASTQEFPQWQRAVARIGLLYECGRLDWSRRAAASGETVGTPSEIMSRLDVACALIDGDRHVLYVNGAAARWLGAQRHLRVVDGRLRGADGERQRQLAAALRTALDGERRAPQALVLKDDDPDNPPQVVTCLPLPGRETRILVFFGTPARSGELAEVLLGAFGLTGAERRLACKLLAGRTLEQAAGEASIRLSTARGYLKAIFAKTGVRRQSEFVAVIGALVPPVWTAAGSPCRRFREAV